MGRRYVYEFLKNAKYRLRPYWKFILASETINPCGPSRLSPSAWDGVRDLCTRVRMTEEEVEATVRDLKQQREDAGEWRRRDERQCESNLLRFYHDRHKEDKRQNVEPQYPLANKFAVLIFSLHYVSSSIETFFSKTRYFNCSSVLHFRH